MAYNATLEQLLDPKYRVKELEVLVDGDIYAHRAASVTDGRMYSVEGNLFKYIKDAQAYCKKLSLPTDLLEVSYQPEPFKHCSASIKQMINSITEALRHKAKELNFTYYLTTKQNFRANILDHYKWNRLGVNEVIRLCGGDEEKARAILRMTPATFEKNKGVVPRKPEHLDKIKGFLKKHYGATEEPPYEADDLIGMRATYLQSIDKPFVIVSIDKDLNCIPGCHYNSIHDEIYEVTEEESLYNFYKQCLTGDETDNIPGIKGVGPKTAEKLLSGAEQSHPGLYEPVLAKWEDHVGEPTEAQEALRKSAQALWILRKWDGDLESKLWQPPELTKELI